MAGRVVQLTEEALHGMGFEELDAHHQNVKVDACQEYLDLVLASLHDSAIEEKQLAHADVGFEISGGGRGVHLKVDIASCDDKELTDKYNGWQKRYNALKNQKARKAITTNEWNTQVTALVTEREQTIKAIEQNVAALHYEKTGVTLEQEKKRRKTDAKDLKTMGVCVGRLVTSNRASSSSREELSEMHKAIDKDFHEQTETQKKAMQEKKAEKAENKDKAAQKAAEKAAKLEEADPVKFAALEKAKADKAFTAKFAADAKATEKALKAKIVADAKAAANKIVADAKAAADKIVADAKKDADDKKDAEEKDADDKKDAEKKDAEAKQDAESKAVESDSEEGF